MARDFLSVAISGVGVEQLFNSAHDICYFCRGHLDEWTIYALMLQLMTNQFLVKEEYCRHQEDDELAEDCEDDTDRQEGEIFQYISDAEEGDYGSDTENGMENNTILDGHTEYDTVHEAEPSSRRPRRSHRQPGEYRKLASGSSQRA